MLIRSFAGAAARLVFAALAMVAFSPIAEAQVLTFVSATGVDTRPCTVQAQPCKTLQRAVTVTSAGGTISILSDLSSSATINKSITIDGGGNSMIGTITVNNAAAVVTLRGLNLTGRGVVANGIRILSAAAVHIEDCTVERYTGDGIKLVATTATYLFVSDTLSRDNGYAGLRVNDTNALVEIENSRFEHNSGGPGLGIGASRINVVRSVASGNNSDGISLYGGTANLTDTTASNNRDWGFRFSDGAAATLASSVARGNYGGVTVDLTASVSITESVITSNSYAINNLGALYTRQNNTVGGSVFGNAAIPLGAF